MKAAELHNVRVKLLWIEGEGAEDFSDLIGAAGRFNVSTGDGLSFLPSERGDILSFAAPRVTEADGKLRIRTAFGNTYVFSRAS